MYAAARAVARQQGVTLTAFIEDCVRRQLGKRGPLDTYTGPASEPNSEPVVPIQQDDRKERIAYAVSKVENAKAFIEYAKSRQAPADSGEWFDGDGNDSREELKHWSRVLIELRKQETH